MNKPLPRITRAPVRYEQGAGLLGDLNRRTAQYAGNALAIADSFVRDTYGTLLLSSFDGARRLLLFPFGGECTRAEADRAATVARQEGCGLILGVGGGKALDCAKAAAATAGLPVAICPTAASSDAPVSAISVLYDEAGHAPQYLALSKNPDLVLADTAVLAAAPVRMTVAGMGDALTTYYEAEACRKKGGSTEAVGRTSLAAMALAKACRDTILRQGVTAVCDCKSGRLTRAVEDVIEANLYLSGIGFESGGLAVAHAVANGLAAVPACDNAMHGEKAAFGLLVQLLLCGKSGEFNRVRGFMMAVGLPVTTSMLSGVGPLGEEDIRAVAAAACRCASIRNVSAVVTIDSLAQAIRNTDRLR